MKNKVLLICAGLLLLIFLTFGTYMWYSFFIQIGISNNSNEKPVTHINSGDILYKDSGNGVNELDAKSLEDSQIENVPSYDFQIENTNKSSSEYILYIEDLPANVVGDGCTEDTLLKRNQLKYQLSLNGKVVKEDFMDKINDNILDKRNIDANTTNSYSLKIYIHDGALDWLGKHYHYKVTLGK